MSILNLKKEENIVDFSKVEKAMMEYLPSPEDLLKYDNLDDKSTEEIVEIIKKEGTTREEREGDMDEYFAIDGKELSGEEIKDRFQR